MFARGRTGLEATEFGGALIRRAARMLHDLETARDACGLGRTRLLDRFVASGPELWHDELYPEEIVVVSPTAHPLARRRRLALEEIHRHEWILPTRGTATRAVCSQALQQAGQRLPRPALESDASFGTLLGFVREFGFLTLLPRAIAEREQQQDSIRILPLNLQMLLPPLAFICLRDRLDVPEIARLRRIVLDTARRGFDRDG